jgi:hypothetical protein
MATVWFLIDAFAESGRNQIHDAIMFQAECAQNPEISIYHDLFSVAKHSMVDFRLRFRRRKPPEAVAAAASMILDAVKECADVFPPLKGAVGAVVYVRDLTHVRSPTFNPQSE